MSVRVRVSVSVSECGCVCVLSVQYIIVYCSEWERQSKHSEYKYKW